MNADDVALSVGHEDAGGRCRIFHKNVAFRLFTASGNDNSGESEK
jgi:hypothetical protein